MGTQIQETPELKSANHEVIIGPETIKGLYLLHHVVSKDIYREHLQRIHINKGRAIATNGHVMVWYESEELDRIKCSVYARDMKVFKGESAVTFKPGQMTNGSTTFQTHDFSPVLESLADGAVHEDTETHKNVEKLTVNHFMSFNPYLLNRMAKAIGLNNTSGLKLVFREPNGPIQVHTKESYRGILMPMRMS